VRAHADALHTRIGNVACTSRRRAVCGTCTVQHRFTSEGYFGPRRGVLQREIPLTALGAKTYCRGCESYTLAYVKCVALCVAPTKCQTCIDKMYDHRVSQLVLEAINRSGTGQPPFKTDRSSRAELLAQGNNVGQYHAKRVSKPTAEPTTWLYSEAECYVLQIERKQTSVRWWSSMTKSMSVVPAVCLHLPISSFHIKDGYQSTELFIVQRQT
jgi:hypothetical protein